MVLNDIENFRSIYDLMACLYLGMKNEVKKMAQIYDFAYDSHPLIEMIAGFSECNRRSIEENRWFNNIKEFLIKHHSQINTEMYLNIIKAIDRECTYDYKYNTQQSFGKTGARVKSLLSDIYDELVLLPQYMGDGNITGHFNNALVRKTKSKRRKNIKADPNSINFYLDNYVLLKKGQYANEPQLYFYDDKNIIKKLISKNNKISLAVVPLIPDNVNEVLNYDFNLSAFNILGIKDKFRTVLVNKYLKILENLIIDNVDIAVFPEMLLDEEILGRIKDLLRRKNKNNLKLLFPGTIWRDCENYCPVLDFNGTEIFRQKKQTCFEFQNIGRKYIENLNLIDKKIHILDINGLGRIFTHICADLLNTPLDLLRREFEANFVFIPAYTPSLEIERLAHQSAENLGSYSLISNSCSAINGIDKGAFPHIGCICMPAKLGTSNTYETIKYCVDSDCKNCEFISCYYTFLIDFIALDSKQVDGSTKYWLKTEKNHVIIDA
ncbi:MAG: hypothetical protein PHE79_01550 [Eubacteriales bacterium]|nr:hypothetical protein [Eubacteriales bacterium]